MVRTRVRRSVTFELRAERAVQLGVRLTLRGLLALRRGTRVRLILRTPAGPWQDADAESVAAMNAAGVLSDESAAGDAAMQGNPMGHSWGRYTRWGRVKRSPTSCPARVV